MKLLDHGSIELLDWMPQRDLDAAVADAARVSHGVLQPDKGKNNRDLIRFLMRHHHTSPFEMVEFKWYVKAPIFVARQWVRHRTASWNEVSARYTEMGDVEFFRPKTYRVQSSTNKQSSAEGSVKNEHVIRQLADDAERDAAVAYSVALGSGVTREQARCVLPVSMYTEWYWKCDLHNTLNFLHQRMHPHAQEEIRVYAEFIYSRLKELCPITLEAWEDFRWNAVTLTALEVEALRTGSMPDRATARELKEWIAKKESLQLDLWSNQPSVRSDSAD